MRYIATIAFLATALGLPLACGDGGGGERTESTGKFQASGSQAQIPGAGTSGVGTDGDSTAAAVGTSTEISGGNLFTIPADATAPSFQIDPYEESLAGNVSALTLATNKPAVSIGFQAASTACAKSGKRICTLSEWQRACRGDKKLEYGFQDGTSPPLSSTCVVVADQGPTVELEVGNKRPECKPSGYSVYNMIGNAAEWVLGPSGPTVATSSHAQTAPSGCSASSVPEQSIIDSGSLDIGFRCCHDP
jgi:formylglycine-generating enzyme required for sulfatase activity